jgi:hypothetical protein
VRPVGLVEHVGQTPPHQWVWVYDQNYKRVSLSRRNTRMCTGVQGFKGSRVQGFKLPSSDRYASVDDTFTRIKPREKLSG